MAIDFRMSNPLAAFQDGYETTDRMFTDAGRRQAGTALASGDYGRAANVLGGIGDLAGVRGVRAEQQAGVDRTKAVSKEKLETLGKVSAALIKVPEAERGAAFQKYAPYLQQVGFGADEIQQGGADLSDQALRTTATVAGQELQKLKVAGSADSGYFAYDEDNVLGGITQLTPPKPARPNWQEMRNADGSSRFVDMNAYAPGPGGFAVPVDGVGVAPAPAAPPAGSPRPSLRPGERQFVAASIQDADAVLTEIAPGVTFSSGLRTPERNKAVGGAPRSYHLSGRARDLVPAAGQTTAQLKAQIEASGFKFRELLDEGDHVHVAWDPPSQSYDVAANGPTPARGPMVVPGDAAPAPKAPEWRSGGDGFMYNQNGDKKRDPAFPSAGDGKANLRDQTTLRKEYLNQPEVKDYRKVANTVANIKSAFADPSGAGDISGIFAYMKALDPDSVVREGEFATAKNSGGIPEAVVNAYNKARDGRFLTPRQRAEFIRQAEGLLANRKSRFDEITNEYRSHAQGYGVDPDRVVGGGQPAPGGGAGGGALQKARDAIARGANREAVIQRLLQNGINPAGL